MTSLYIILSIYKNTYKEDFKRKNIKILSHDEIHNKIFTKKYQTSSMDLDDWFLGCLFNIHINLKNIDPKSKKMWPCMNMSPSNKFSKLKNYNDFLYDAYSSNEYPALTPADVYKIQVLFGFTVKLSDMRHILEEFYNKNFSNKGQWTVNDWFIEFGEGKINRMKKNNN
mgnify:FL=1